MKRLALIVASAAIAGGVPMMALAGEPAPAKQAGPFGVERVAALQVGDPAPQMSVEKWVKGDSVTGFEKGRVYMVEFWATWCGPCIASMPHITELQKQYKDKGFTVIGVTTEDKRNTLEKVEKMVKDKADVMGYTVAWDSGEKTRNAFFKAAEQGGIPCSFLVDRKGMIAYIGHPMGIDKVLADVIADKHDLKALAARNVAEQKATGQFMKTMEALRSGKYEDGYKFAGEFIAGEGWNMGDYLNALAWTIVDPEGSVKEKNLDLALKAATRANELSEHKDAGTLDTLAWCHFAKGDAKKAIEIETKAIALCKDDKMKAELTKALEKFGGTKAN